jgi:hypothetical protein
VEVLGLTRTTQWTTGAGRTEFLQLNYYRPARLAADSEVLNLALPAIAASGDSIVQLNELRSDRWARYLGVRISTSRTFLRQPDSSWVAR